MNVMIVIDSTDQTTNGTLHERTNEHRVAAAEEGLPPVIMFAFDSYFPAVAATDLLVSRSNSNSTRKENVQIGTGSGCWYGTVRRHGGCGCGFPWKTADDKRGCSKKYLANDNTGYYCTTQGRADLSRSFLALFGLNSVYLALTKHLPRSGACAYNTPQVPVADILCCKPSELAFYPLPKLMIRRVGDHEAHSATRAVR